MVIAVKKLEVGIKTGAMTRYDPVSDQVFTRIVAGLLSSNRTPIKVLAFYSESQA